MSDAPGTGRRWALRVAAALLAVTLVWWVVHVSLLEPAARSDASQYGQFVLAAIGLLMVIAASVKKKSDSASAPYTEAQIEQLTTVLRDQWTKAAQERGLLEPRLPIRWRGPASQVAGPVSAALESREAPGRFPTLPRQQRIDSVAQLHSGGRRQLHDVYGGLASGRLMLVGEPGSGKSSAAILLLLDALKSRQEAGAEARMRIPVPVILTMHGWDPRTTPVTDWVAGELVRTHQLIRDVGRAASPGSRWRLTW